MRPRFCLGSSGDLSGRWGVRLRIVLGCQTRRHGRSYRRQFEPATRPAPKARGTFNRCRKNQKTTNERNQM
jgi:hypothetical protein